MGRPDRVRGASPSQIQQVRPSGGGVMEDIRALNSSILLITQKIKYIVRNEKILGRNLIVLNKKIKTLEEKIVSPLGVDGTAPTGADSALIIAMQKKLELLEAIVSDLSANMVTKSELKELRYVIDAINPLEYATLSQVKDMIDKSKKK